MSGGGDPFDGDGDGPEGPGADPFAGPTPPREDPPSTPEGTPPPPREIPETPPPDETPGAPPPETPPGRPPPEAAAPAAAAPAASPAVPPAAPAPEARDAVAQLIAHPFDWELVAAVEAVHAARPDLPPPGRSSDVAEDPVRLRQRPTLSFQPSPVVAARRVRKGEAEVVEIEQVAFGPLGADGPLPLHVTEDALHERAEGRGWLIGFLDVFNHRMTQLMVAALQSGRPAARGAFGPDDPWPRWIASLFGAGASAGSAPFRERDALPDDLKLRLAGWFASKRRSRAALAGVLETVIGAPVEVRPHAPEWLDMPAARQTRLGGPGATLGRDTLLGPRFFSVQSRVQVRTAPLSAAAFAELLPGAPRLAAARDAAKLLLGLAAGWELQLRLRAAEVPATRPDGTRRLGLDSWLRAEGRTGVLEDVVLDGAARNG